MLLAEGRSLDGLVTAVQLFFVSTALPSVLGLFICRLGGGASVAAFCLGLLSALPGAWLLGWMVWERSTVPGFYLAAGTPLLVGVGTCLLARRACKNPGSTSLTKPPRR